MSINGPSAPRASFAQQFALSSTGAPSTAPASNDRPKAQVWLNIGVEVEYPLDDGSTETRLMGLPVGLPVDTMEALALPRGNNADYVDFVHGRNNLLTQLQDMASKLKPGESLNVNLTCQLRRVADAVAPVASTNNRFARKLEVA